MLSEQTAQGFLTFYVTISLRIVCSGRVPESRTQETNPGAGCFIVCVSEVLCEWGKGGKPGAKRGLHFPEQTQSNFDSKHYNMKEIWETC